MKALLGPTDYANQPMLLTRALRERGVDASHVLYLWRDEVPYGYRSDRVLKMTRQTWLRDQLAFVNEALDSGIEVFHLWNRSLVAPPGPFSFFSGFDLPYLKASGAKIVYRFTGYDLRRASLDVELNPWSPLLHGYETPYDEEIQAAYLEQLRDWVDCFVVQDPEMKAFLPEAEVIPRGVDLAELEYVGVGEAATPLVVHAPSDRQWKGTDGVLAAVEALRSKGVPFEFKLIEGMEHSEALDWYRRADVVIDQLLIGWYGVLAVEAMALGKPVVAYVRKPLDEAFGPDGLPIVNTTLDDLERDLERVLRDPALRRDLGERGRSFAAETHDIRKVAEATERLYERVLAAPDTSRLRPPRYQAAMAAEPGVSAAAQGTVAPVLNAVHDRTPPGELSPGNRLRRHLRRLKRAVARQRPG